MAINDAYKRLMKKTYDENAMNKKSFNISLANKTKIIGVTSTPDSFGHITGIKLAYCDTIIIIKYNNTTMRSSEAYHRLSLITFYLLTLSSPSSG